MHLLILYLKNMTIRIEITLSATPVVKLKILATCTCHNLGLLFLFIHIQFGITPLDVARDSCRHDVVEYLEQILSKCSISTLYEF